MNQPDLKYGIYDPLTKMFYTIPVSSAEEFRKFILSLESYEEPNSNKIDCFV